MHEGAQNCVLSDGTHSIGAVLEARAVEAFERSMAGTLDPLSRLEGALVYPEPYEIVLNMSNRQFCIKLASFQWAGAENAERIGLPRFVMEDPEIVRLYDNRVAELQQHQTADRQPVQLQAQQQRAQQAQAQEQQALMQMLGRGLPFGCAAFPVDEAEPHHVIPRFLCLPPDQERLLQAQLRDAQASQGTDSQHGSDGLNSACSARSRVGGCADASGGASGSSTSRPIVPTPLARETRRGAPPAALPFCLPSNVTSGARTATRAGEAQLGDGATTPSAETRGAADAGGACTERAHAAEASSSGRRPAFGTGCLVALSQAEESPPGFNGQAPCQLAASQAPFTQAPFTQAPFTHLPLGMAALAQAESSNSSISEVVPWSQAPFTQAQADLFPATHAPASQPPATQAERSPSLTKSGESPALGSCSQVACGAAQATGSESSDQPLLSQLPCTQYHLPDAASEESDRGCGAGRRVQQQRPWEAANPETELPDLDGLEAEQHGWAYGQEMHAEAMEHGPTIPGGDPLDLAGFDPRTIVREVFSC